QPAARQPIARGRRRRASVRTISRHVAGDAPAVRLRTGARGAGTVGRHRARRRSRLERVRAALRRRGVCGTVGGAWRCDAGTRSNTPAYTPTARASVALYTAPAT